MMTFSKQSFLELAQNHRYVAVYRQIVADTLTPITALNTLATPGTPSILLESGLKFRESGSYSFIGLQPYATLRCHQGRTTITSPDGDEYHCEDPIQLLRAFQQRFRCAPNPKAPLLGHVMGILAYDAAVYFESALSPPESNADALPECCFHAYRVHLVFDHDQQSVWVAVIADSQGNPDFAYEQAEIHLQAVLQQLQQTAPLSPVMTMATPLPANLAAVQVNLDDETFANLVLKAQDYIQAGDAFQIVLSRTFQCSLNTDPFTIYRALRQKHPTTYMFYVVEADFTLFGASPEKLVSLHHHRVAIAPIAGTAAIQANDDPLALAAELRDNPKERAEHMMLVDLARNDIGRICIPGSIQVTELMTALPLSRVVHLVSYVEGELAPEYDAIDVLGSAFPAGTLSGAPKIRAMQIIAELEPNRRQFYGGAVCKIDPFGNLDSCIIIRSGIVRGNQLEVRAGAGIVFDSDPQAEAQETRHKASSVLQTVALMQGEV